jgi:hypothetical protein
MSQRVVSGLKKLDTLLLFAEPVTEKVAKHYFDMIRNPMDLRTMHDKSLRLVLFLSFFFCN